MSEIAEGVNIEALIIEFLGRHKIVVEEKRLSEVKISSVDSIILIELITLLEDSLQLVFDPMVFIDVKNLQDLHSLALKERSL